MQRYFDFRSDTVTHPTPAMREAMAAAEVGDDVYGEDPTVIRLEEKAAAMLGMEAGLLVSSGTMGNLVAVLAVCERGDEAIMGTAGHTFLHEAGGVSALGGVVIHTIPNQEDGSLDLHDIQTAIKDLDLLLFILGGIDVLLQDSDNLGHVRPVAAVEQRDEGIAQAVGIQNAEQELDHSIAMGAGF